LPSPELPQPEARAWIARAFTVVEDLVYIGMGLLLAGYGIGLLITTFVVFVEDALAGFPLARVVGLLDRVLLILLIVELLYTVQVSFREHALMPEPFLLIGLIAAVRRVLVVTAKFGELHEEKEEVFRPFILELSVLTALIVTLAVSLLLLSKKGAVAART